jgi:uncharacterized membrane protein
MNWSTFYGLRSYLRSSLWIVPFIAIPSELVISRLLRGLDAWLGWNLLGFALPGAQALLQATVTATLSFVVFTFGSLLVAIQVAGAQLALSPAINDPTTAVLAIDQLHRLLRMVGNRDLRIDEISDGSGQLRVIFRTPNWEDFVNLAFSEIRSCGSNNLQIVRRLRAMIDNLVQTLPAHCHPPLQQQLRLLDREIERKFAYPEELALARVADSQGLGGRSGQIRPGKRDGAG